MSPRNVRVEGNAHVVVNPASYNCLCRLAQIVVLYVFTVKSFLTDANKFTRVQSLCLCLT